MTLLALIVSRGVEVRWVSRLGASRGYIAVGPAPSDEGEGESERTIILKSERGQRIRYGDRFVPVLAHRTISERFL
jgi:hypothetical protein